MPTYDTIRIPENDRPLVTCKLERGQALLWAPYPGSVADDVTVTAERVTIVRFTLQRAVLRFADGAERCRKPGYYNVFFAGWCERCARPAHDRLLCGRCGGACATPAPAHVFPATLRLDCLDTARRFRLMVERGWTQGRAWEYIYDWRRRLRRAA